MPQYEVTQLRSPIEVTEALQALLNHAPTYAADDALHSEWKVIEQHLREGLCIVGQEGWDFVLMDWPAEVPLFNVVLNNPSLSSALSLDNLVSLLATLRFPWCIRIECLNRIQNGLMVGGDVLRDVLVTQNKVLVWEAESTRY